jgi:membrane protein implicated in regulation of membrane protease activity
MISNLILDISIGCLLLISIGLFYEMTAIFYTTFNWWIILLLVPAAAVYSLVGGAKKLSANESESLIYAKSIQPEEQETLICSIFRSIAIVIMWLIPIAVDLMLGGMAIFTAHLLNSNLHLDDVYLICLTPAIILSITCLSKRLRETLSTNINSSIYSSFGSIGIITNTFIVEWGGYLTAKALGI